MLRAAAGSLDERSSPLARHTYTALMRRLSRAGFGSHFVHLAILPDWWNAELLPDIEVRVARFLGIPLSTVGDPGATLAPPGCAEAQLRRVRDLDRDRLAPAIHSALQIGAAVVRSLKDRTQRPQVPPEDGLAWRDLVRPAEGPVTLDGILDDLWRRGIPVVPIDVLPAPSPQGISCIIGDRPVILLGHKHDEPGRVAFLTAHEVGHIAAGDCSPGRPVVDEEDVVLDDADMERRADRYATRLLIGDDSIPTVAGASYRQLASHAARLERSAGADASAILFAWAAKTGDYARASMAVRALYRASGARQRLRRHFDRHMDLEAATESDRALLRCVHGDQERDETGR